jgi:SAM-dependent methyltransferase
VYTKLLHELDPLTIGRFDLITFFQVLEHVPDPLSVMQQAAGVLNPGGYIAVAVPAAAGAYRWCPWDPHQWPPHHVSHWQLADFDNLAKAAKLTVVKQGGDVLTGTLVKDLLLLHNQLAPQVGHRPRFGGTLLPRIISQLYRKTGLKHIFPHWGSSIYGFFQKV